jgi:hypothetical protein
VSAGISLSFKSIFICCLFILILFCAVAVSSKSANEFMSSYGNTQLSPVDHFQITDYASVYSLQLPFKMSNDDNICSNAIKRNLNIRRMMRLVQKNLPKELLKN